MLLRGKKYLQTHLPSSGNVQVATYLSIKKYVHPRVSSLQRSAATH
jgi:hypothetical protein